jgi:hypothetical protein|mmetsp:Transcript_97917/g.280074  ORF Transcript_97917/g.280074 Transcript_97917/m.280074 type:complete len:142 (-) Transcript_97917:181-606(-)
MTSARRRARSASGFGLVPTGFVTVLFSNNPLLPDARYPITPQHSLVDLLYLDSYDVKSGTSDVGSSEHHLEELTAAFDSGLVARGHTLVVVDDNFDADRHEFDGGDGGGGSNAEEVCDGALSEAVRCVTILTRRSRARADF